MIREVKNLLSRHRYYRYLVAGAFLSSIGSGLTQVAVYGELSRLNANAEMFALAFAISVIPGLFSGQLGVWLTARVRPLILLILMELVGAIGVLIPIFGSRLNNPHLLQMAEFVSALIAGVVIPATTALTSNYFSDEELPAVSGIGVYVFSANVIFGYGLGTLLYGFVASNSYFFIDILSYLAGAGLMVLAYRGDRGLRLTTGGKSVDAPVTDSFCWRSLTHEQKRAFLLLPALTLAGTPAVALLPVIGERFGKVLGFHGIVLSTVMLFLFAKTLGQMLGPLLLKSENFDKLLMKPRILLSLLLGFGSLYWIASWNTWILISVLAIVLAHILSNLIYVVAVYAIPRHFKGNQAAIASAKQYQVQVLLMAICGLGSGWMAETVSPSWIIASDIVISSALIAYLLWNQCDYKNVMVVQSSI